MNKTRLSNIQANMALVRIIKRIFSDPSMNLMSIHGLAPTMKWALVIANIGDLKRPADRISVTQSASLTATGAIWSRYSLVIIPKNWNLFSVNVFVFITGFYQLARALKYKYETEHASLPPPPSATENTTK